MGDAFLCVSMQAVLTLQLYRINVVGLNNRSRDRSLLGVTEDIPLFFIQANQLTREAN